MSDADAANWRALNRANWDERVAVHLKPTGYDLASLRAGRGKLHPIEEVELGADTLKLAQRGASVVGLDFSPAAIAAARGLAAELGLADRARFVEADLYDAPIAIAEPASFDLVYTTWGVTCWLPDIRRWAGIVAQFLKPGGRLYYADAHPAAYVFDDLAKLGDGKPGYFAPYFERKPIVMVDPKDYADPTAHLANATNVDWLHEHPQVPWRMFEMLVKKDNGDWHWPDRQWLPLAVSLQASRPPCHPERSEGSHAGGERR